MPENNHADETSLPPTYTPSTDGCAQMLLDTMPLSCNFWDENYHLVDCNEATVRLFGLSDKEAFMASFYALCPEAQPDGRASNEAVIECVKMAFELGHMQFEWMHQKLNGEPIPTNITLVRAQLNEHPIVVAYLHDLREINATLAKMREADERTHIMFDATPLCCNFWDSNYNNIDCNQEAVDLFELSSKQEYLERFFELSPLYQPDGMLSEEKALTKVQTAFSEGRVRFEWMHQKLNGSLIPAEITLVRVKRSDGYIVAGYTRDLRELTETISILNQLELLAFTDSLTGVYNRRYFTETAAKEFAHCEYSKKQLSIIMFDLDHFKRVNDTYGHLAGDEVLKQVTASVQKVLRSGDLLSRYGGEEFLILVLDGEKQTAEKLAWRIKDEVAQAVTHYEGIDIKITISIGIATADHDDLNIDEVIKRADEALYEAKQSGRNTVVKR